MSPKATGFVAKSKPDGKVIVIVSVDALTPVGVANLISWFASVFIFNRLIVSLTEESWLASD
jgi:hypothetical protein